MESTSTSTSTSISISISSSEGGYTTRISTGGHRRDGQRGEDYWYW